MPEETAEHELPLWMLVGAVHHRSMPPWIKHPDFSTAMVAAQRRALAKWPRNVLADLGLERVHIVLEFGIDSRTPRIKRLSDTAVLVRWFGSLAELVLAAGEADSTGWFDEPVDAAMAGQVPGRGVRRCRVIFGVRR